MKQLFLVALVPVMLGADQGGEVAFVDRSKQTPDFCQVDPAGKLPRDGGSFCGPVAASNGLMYLSNVGYPNLKPQAADEKASQIGLIHKLGSADFMNAHPVKGTGPSGVMTGVKKYVEAAGYSIDRIEFQGADPIKRFKKVADIPTADFLRSGLSVPNSVVLLNIGWRKFDAETKTYTRVGGHWLALVGYGKTADGKNDPNAFILHDSSPRSGMEFTTEHVTAHPIQGTFVRTQDDDAPKETPADGYIELKGDIKLRPGSDTAVVDRAILVVLKPAGK